MYVAHGVTGKSRCNTAHQVSGQREKYFNRREKPKDALDQRGIPAVSMTAMPSQNDPGRRFQEVARKALQSKLNRPIDIEVSLPLPERRPHSFDLATVERDVVAECRLASWQGGTGRLREAAEYLKALPGKPTRLLIIQGDSQPVRGETFGRYFVRLNEDRLESVVVLELFDADRFECLFGSWNGHQTAQQSRPATERTTSAGSAAPPEKPAGEVLSTEELDLVFRQLDRILDWVEEMRTRDESRRERVARLRGDDKLPKAVAIQIHNLLKAETEFPTNGEVAAVKNAWAAVTEWAKDQGCLINS